MFSNFSPSVLCAFTASKSNVVVVIYIYVDVSQAVDLTLLVAPSHCQWPPPPPPPFPEALSATTTIPIPSGASNYLSAGPAQSHPRTLSSTVRVLRPLPLCRPSMNTHPLNIHPHLHSRLNTYQRESGSPHPAFLTHQVQTTHAPTTHLPPRAHQSITMPIPELHNDSHVSRGFHPGYAFQAPISHFQSHSGMLEAPQIPQAVDRRRNRAY
ncbi:hypothetical protein EDB86DRAFT_2877907, partial [Lactarius hatsudake]